jgi:hypothetical protein
MRVRLYIATSIWAVYGLLTLSVPRTANAAEWSAQPSVRLGWEHDDNPRLTTQSHESVSGSIISPKLDLSVSSDIWQVMGSMQALQKRYSGESDLDRDDRYYNLITSYKSERSTWQLAGSKAQASVIASEQISPDTGSVDVQKKYDLHSINPSWLWAVNELTQLQLAYSSSNLSYVNGENAGFHDYATRSVSAQLTNQFDPADQIFFSTGYSIFDVPATTLESRSATYQAGVTRTFSETMNGTLSAGMRKSNTEQNGPVCSLSLLSLCLQTVTVAQSVKKTSSVYNANIEKKYETTSFNLAVSRAFNPSGLGDEVQADTQIATLNKRFTSRLTGTFSAGNYTYKSVTGNLPGVDRRLYTIQPELRWMWTQELSMVFGYQYVHVKQVDEDKPATSNLVYWSLRYQWPKKNFFD